MINIGKNAESRAGDNFKVSWDCSSIYKQRFEMLASSVKVFGFSYICFMNGKYDKIQWVIQKNLTNLADLDLLKSGCRKTGVGYEEVFIIPFTDSLPDFNKDKAGIFYGSTTFNKLVSEDENISKGLFFDTAKFSMENYFEKWGSNMLNFGASVTTFAKLMQSGVEPGKLLFIRPDDDSKSFAGEVKKFSDIQDWYERLKMFENTNLSLNSKIVVSEPYQLRYEWRLWIVNKKVVASSKYREDFKLKKEAGCPLAVVDYAEKRCAEYTPHDVFVMDICQTGDSYYVIECGCMNGAGFYSADIEKIVSCVTSYFHENHFVLS
jgi:hypothetical protein